MSPNTIAIIGIISNLIAVIFLIWGLADLEWSVFRKARKALYIISFVIFCLTLILMILIIVFANLRSVPNFITFNNIGKILCLITIWLCALAFIFLLIAEILILVDYSDIEEAFGPGRNIPSHDRAAAILPGILGLISSVIVSLCANILYKMFNDNILTSFDI